MHFRRFGQLAAGFPALMLAAVLHAQAPGLTRPHTVVVRLVERGGAVPYAFEPASVNVDPGDTIQFTEAANVIHNVRFTREPPGVKLGSAQVSPYLTKLGDVYRLVIDKRFAAGTYNYVCEPHELLGMKGTMVVLAP